MCVLSADGRLLPAGRCVHIRTAGRALLQRCELRCQHTFEPSIMWCNWESTTVFVLSTGWSAIERSCMPGEDMSASRGRVVSIEAVYATPPSHGASP